MVFKKLFGSKKKTVAEAEVKKPKEKKPALAKQTKAPVKPVKAAPKAAPKVKATPKSETYAEKKARLFGNKK